ncbi:hypothetical protein [Celeribacter neptunius]|uniref:Uncharacterized protein n=1 Tax=Celeribacter neptunius TaxID=588602 RepID=A0A1I3WKZ3_9RHOB|nr:hypothetical protein [Celeribacter neptunius]SFK07121.1 hypothetical protein SAMN04487991_3763 [Celeribacter neptunius]
MLSSFPLPGKREVVFGALIGCLAGSAWADYSPEACSISRAFGALTLTADHYVFVDESGWDTPTYEIEIRDDTGAFVVLLRSEEGEGNSAWLFAESSGLMRSEAFRSNMLVAAGNAFGASDAGADMRVVIQSDGGAFEWHRDARLSIDRSGLPGDYVDFATDFGEISALLDAIGRQGAQTVEISYYMNTDGSYERVWDETIDFQTYMGLAEAIDPMTRALLQKVDGVDCTEY